MTAVVMRIKMILSLRAWPRPNFFSFWLAGPSQPPGRRPGLGARVCLEYWNTYEIRVCESALALRGVWRHCVLWDCRRVRKAARTEFFQEAL